MEVLEVISFIELQEAVNPIEEDRAIGGSCHGGGNAGCHVLISLV